MSATTLDRGAGRDRVAGGGVDPRIEARRREVEREVQRDHGRRRRSRVAAFVIVTAAIALVVGLVQSPLLDVDRFDVASTGHVSTDELLAVSGVELGDPLALVDAEAIRARILVLPWVADASVTAKWPGTLRLAVTERVPVAMAPVDGGFVLIDADGRVLGPSANPPAPDLAGPRPIEGLVVPAPGNHLDARGQVTLEVLAAVPSGVRTRLEAVVIDGDGDVSLRLRPDMVAVVGSTADLDQKMRTLKTVLAQVVLDDIETIDLQVAGRADVRRRVTTPPSTTTGSTPGRGSLSASSTAGSPSGTG